jgi:hypothetical protein
MHTGDPQPLHTQIGTVREPELRVQIVAERSTFDEDPASEQTMHPETTTTTPLGLARAAAALPQRARSAPRAAGRRPCVSTQHAPPLS